MTNLTFTAYLLLLPDKNFLSSQFPYRFYKIIIPIDNRIFVFLIMKRSCTFFQNIITVFLPVTTFFIQHLQQSYGCLMIDMLFILRNIFLNLKQPTSRNCRCSTVFEPAFFRLSEIHRYQCIWSNICNKIICHMFCSIQVGFLLRMYVA